MSAFSDVVQNGKNYLSLKLMKSLLQINTIIHSSGTGRIVEDIGKLAISNGWKSTIAYGLKSRQSASQLIRIGNNWNIYWHGIETRLFDNHCFSSRIATRKLISRLDASKPKVIHLHNLHGYYLNVELLFNYLATINIPIVWTLHDCWAFTGHCCHFTYAQCDRWKKGCYSCPQKRSYPMSLLADRSKKNYEHKKKLFTSVKNLTIITVSEWLKELVQESFLSKYPIEVINNGIDLNGFKQTESSYILAKYGLEGKQIIMGCASGWGNRKGYKDFIRLSSLIDKSQHIVLVGLSKKQIKDLPSGILGIERTENINELAALYSIADVFLSLSLEETFGLVTVEAMSCGTPVVVYNTTASPELVSDECGRIVKVGDIKGIKNAIRELTSLDKMILSKACRKRVENFYNKEDQFKRYVDKYEQIIS